MKIRSEILKKNLRISIFFCTFAASFEPHAQTKCDYNKGKVINGASGTSSVKYVYSLSAYVLSQSA